MSKGKIVKFQDALDIIESLPEYQQEDLIEVLQHRISEHRRELLAENVEEAKREYSQGDVKKGTVDDLMKELS